MSTRQDDGPDGSEIVGRAPQSQGDALPSIAALSVPDPQMIPKAKRRQFSKEYKRRIVKEANACTGRGELGALLRREGLYDSTLAGFRLLDAQGLLEPGSGCKSKAAKDPEYQAVLAERTQFQRDIRQLKRKLAHAEKIIDIQKKVAILMGETLQEMPFDENED
jgi:transposase